MDINNGYSTEYKLYLQIIMVSVVAIFFSSFTVWLIDSWIKYPLFGFEISIIFIIYFVLHKFDFTLNFCNFMIIKKRFVKYYKKRHILAASILTIFSGILFLLNLFELRSGFIQLGFAFACISFLLGYVILNLFNITKYFSKLEVIVLSFIISFIFSGFSSLFFIHVEEHIRGIVLPLVFFLIGTISIMKDSKIKDINIIPKPKSLVQKIDVIAIIISISFYCFFFFLMYPSTVMMPDLDISRHYNWSVTLSKSPDLYIGFNYLLFHSYGATLNVLSGLDQNISNIQTIPILLNLLLPISIYVLAKRYLQDLDKRVPAISIIFYTVLSNFSFIYFTYLKTTEGSSDIIILRDVAEKAFNGSINFLQPFNFFTPMSVSFIMLIIAYVLLKIDNITRPKLISLFTVLILSIYLVHISEAITFLTFMIVYSFISKRNTLNIINTLCGLLIGSVMIDIFIFYEFFIWPSQIRFTNLGIDSWILVFMPILIVTTLIYRWKLLPLIPSKLILKIKEKNPIYDIYFSYKERIITIIIIVITFTYLFGLIIWIFTDNFKSSMVTETGYIPWFMYPIVLGIIGFLGISSLRNLQNKSMYDKSTITIILVNIAVMLVIGKSISLINENITSTGYWEIRLIMIVFIFLSLLAPIPLIKFFDNLYLRRQRFLCEIWITIVISSIVLLGFSSLILQTEFWYINNTHGNRISDNEWLAINYLKKILQQDNKAFTISPSKYSTQTLVFAGSPYSLAKSDLLTSSQYPDIPLLSLTAYNLDHAYLYLHTRDIPILNNISNGWFSTYLIPTLPIIYANPQVTIYNISKVSYPVSNSSTVLVNPIDPPNNNWQYVNELLSQSETLYDEKLDKDPQVFKNKNIIMSFDPVITHSFLDNFTSRNNISKWHNKIGNWSYTMHSLHGGSNLKTVDLNKNIILSPAASTSESIISASFRINNLDNNVSNYVSIVNSFKDLKNYQQAGINIYNGNIYVLFSKIVNGTLIYNPEWPGLKTNLKWNPGNLFNMSLTINKTSQDLIINGIKYYSINNTNPVENGSTGLSYGRIKDIDFYNFKSQDNDKLNLREFKDYINYVEDGGHLFIFNTNGYGLLYDYLSNMSLPLYSNLNMPIHQNKDQLNTSISINEKHLKKGTITYINIYPYLVKLFESKILFTDLLHNFDNISKILPLEKFKSYQPNFKDLNIFKELTGTGSINLNTSSVIFLNDSIPAIWVKEGKYIHKITNITNLDISNYKSVMINDPNDHILVNNGRGLYSKILLDEKNNASIKFFFGNATLKAISNNGTYKLDNVSNIYAQEYPLSMYLKQPSISVNGNITLKDYFFGYFTNSKQDRIINGNISFDVYMSDLYTLIRNLSISGQMYKIPEIPKYDEFDFLKSNFNFSKLYSIPILVWILLLLPFFLFFTFLKNVPH